jgi:hypothetical protein
LGAKTKKQIASDKLELAEADDQAADIAVLALEKGTSESDQGLSTESEA